METTSEKTAEEKNLRMSVIKAGARHSSEEMESLLELRDLSDGVHRAAWRSDALNLSRNVVPLRRIGCQG
jgi:hypothetical protein